MIEVIYNKEEHNLPIKSWVSDIEENALKQAKNLSKVPFAFRHIALMPDCHMGFGMPIGGVLATSNVIIPNAVGVDIGCGMCALKTSLKVEQLDTDTLKKIMGEIRKAVPVGFKHHNKPQDKELMPKGIVDWVFDSPGVYPVVSKEWNNALTQIGTLGGGNHFIEIQKGSDGFVWIMIHSGSRNIGLQVATYYNKIAEELNAKWFSSIPKEHELAFLPVDSKEGINYINEMRYCVDFALANRRLMMDSILKCFCDVLNMNIFSKNLSYTPYNKETNKYTATAELGIEPMINIAHNYARLENHFGKNVWVHRKGATSAKVGEIGIIPGSQGTCSYIVEGLGNPESFMSCSHGAGRKMGRNEAIRGLNLQEEIKKLTDKGILHGIRHADDLDEASGAYKDIDVVMNNQKDLVKILVKLEPMGVIKG